LSKRKGDPGYSDGWCIHFRSIGQFDTCEVGVSYNDFHGTPFAERPCFLLKGKPKPGAKSCPHLRLPTAEEMAAHEIWVQGHMGKVATVMKGIAPWRQKHKGKSAREVVECPACRGRLHLSIAAYNGHVHGRCETDGCVNWME
jgi:hypothetical protein